MEPVFDRICREEIRAGYIRQLAAYDDPLRNRRGRADRAAAFLQSEAFLQRVEEMRRGRLLPAPPRAVTVPKKQGKRTVYAYEEGDRAILGLMNYAFRQYRRRFSPNAFTVPSAGRTGRPWLRSSAWRSRPSAWSWRGKRQRVVTG